MRERTPDPTRTYSEHARGCTRGASSRSSCSFVSFSHFPNLWEMTRMPPKSRSHFAITGTGLGCRTRFPQWRVSLSSEMTKLPSILLSNFGALHIISSHLEGGTLSIIRGTQRSFSRVPDCNPPPPFFYFIFKALLYFITTTRVFQSYCKEKPGPSKKDCQELIKP